MFSFFRVSTKVKFQNSPLFQVFPDILVKIHSTTHSGTPWYRMCLMLNFYVLTSMHPMAGRLMPKYCITLPYHWNKFIAAWTHICLLSAGADLFGFFYCHPHDQCKPYIQLKGIKAKKWICTILKVQTKAGFWSCKAVKSPKAGIDDKYGYCLKIKFEAKSMCASIFHISDIYKPSTRLGARSRDSPLVRD